MHTRIAGVAAFAAAFLSFAAQAAMAAETEAATAGSEEQVVVTADPLRRADAHLAQPVSVLRGETLQRQPLRNIGEAVSNQLGVTSADFGPSVGRPTIRGLSGTRVRVLDDGVGTMDVSSVSPDHAVAIEPLLARQIEIFRGPATLLYGSGASGGLVNVVDDRIPSALPERVNGEVLGQYETVDDGRTGAFRVDGGLGQHLALHLDGLRVDTGNYDIPNFAERVPEPGEPAGELLNSDAEVGNYSGGASFVHERGFLGVAVSRLDRDYGVPGAHEHEEEPDAAETLPGEGVRIDQAQTRVDIKGAFDDPLPGLREVRTRWGINDHTHKELEPDGALGTLLLNQETEGRFELVHAPWLGVDGVVGVQIQQRDFDARGEEAFVPKSTQDSVAVFLVEKRDFGRLHVDAGLRYEDNDADDERGARSVSHGVYSLSGGLSYRHASGVELGGSVTRAERAPALEELFANGPHLASNTFEIGNAGLDTEVSTNLDLFIRRGQGRWRWTASVFYNDISNFIFGLEQDRNGDGVADRVEPDFGETGLVVDEEDALLLVTQTQEDARFWGVELESIFELMDGPWGALDWRLWLDSVDAELERRGHAPRIPPLRVGSGLEWRRERWSAGVAAVRYAPQNEVSALETRTDGYVDLGLHAEYALPLPEDRELQFFARGTNLTDDEQRRHTSYLKDSVPLPGIGAQLGVRLSF
ncbi:MAG TPA: TonB-dependent receptor [Gammaproteobacteria bacterium]|nr:TonB-dependent receptor [Gammaproteobacteria bacterium]